MGVGPPEKCDVFDSPGGKVVNANPDCYSMVQGTFRSPMVAVQDVGALTGPDVLALKPNVAEDPGARLAFQLACVALMRPADVLPVAFHISVTVMGQLIDTDQPVTGVDPALRTATSTVRPDCQSDRVVTFRLIPTGATGGALALGVGVGVGVWVRVAQ